MRRVLFIALLLCLLSPRVGQASPLNMIQNGSFSEGNIHFGTDYEHRDANTEGMWDPGTYTVDMSAAGDHALWETGTGHSLEGRGPNAFMLVNGHDDKESTVWRQLIGTEEGESYTFKAFAKNLCAICDLSVAPRLAAYANDKLLGFLDTDGAGVWIETALDFVALNARTIVEIRTLTYRFHGDDFGLDDLYLGEKVENTATPEPMSLLLIGSVLLGGGTLGRKRLGIRA